MNKDKKEGNDDGSNASETATTKNWETKLPQNKESNISGNEQEQDAPGLMKTKPSREIYKPPNLRKCRTSHFQPNVGGSGRPKGPQYIYYFHSQSYTLPPEENLYNNGSQRSNNNGNPLQLNLSNAKEYQGNGQKGQWPNFNQSGPQARKDPFPLVQSKSANSMFAQFQKHCQLLEQQRCQQDTNLSQEELANLPKNLEAINENMPVNVKGRVRFLEGNQHGSDPFLKQMEALKIEANNGGQHRIGMDTSIRKPELTRSKSMIHRNPPQIEWCAVSPPFNKKLWDAFHPPCPTPQAQIWPSDWTAPGRGQQETKKNWTPSGSGIKRSKSFGCKTTQVQPLLQPNSVPIAPLLTPNINDFHLNKWPKGVVEPVTMAINGIERVPARHKIDMVTRMFGTMLGDYESTLTLVPVPEEHRTLSQFILPAVHIFLYFIQRESDETILESFLNNSLMTYQSLCQGSKVNIKKPANGSSPLSILSMSTTSRWIVFLQLLSTFYQKTKVIRGSRQKSIEKFCHRLLALLCDSAIVVIRLSPISYTTELVDTLFTVMTSLGRDMETKFPLKLKEILAGVRDVLLGVSVPAQNAGAQDGNCAQVHKTLMQLIELHAANWQLPASAVRYYYANSSNNQSQFVQEN